MTPALMAEIWVFALAVFVGFEVISKVPVVLHTPLMSGTNAIHGIVVIGGILVLGSSTSPLETVLGLIAVLFGGMNFAGGFVVTDRMLEMFKKREPVKPADAAQDKDGFENYLHAQVCGGGMTLAEAQHEIATLKPSRDWKLCLDFEPLDSIPQILQQ